MLWVIGEVEGAAREGVLTEEGVSFNIESGIHCTSALAVANRREPFVGARLVPEACQRLATKLCIGTRDCRVVTPKVG